jgi:hypothetical protein
MKEQEYSGSNRYRHRLPQQSPSSSSTKRKNGQKGRHKIKKLCTKEMVSKLKRPPAKWEKLFTSYTSKDW